MSMDPQTYSELTNTTPFVDSIRSNILRLANHCIFNLTTFYNNITVHFKQNNEVYANTTINATNNSTRNTINNSNDFSFILPSSQQSWDPQIVINEFCSEYSNNTICDPKDCFISQKTYENVVLYTIIASSCFSIVIILFFIKMCCR